MKHNPKATKKYRRELRNNATYAEHAFWTLVRMRQLEGRRFRRQHGIGPFIVDFYCPEERLVIELDGSVHDDLLQAEYDWDRQQYLENLVYKILRFPNESVIHSSDVVLELIVEAFGWFKKS